MGVHQLYLCLGGNLGNKAEIFRETVNRIAQDIGKITGESPVYLTAPWGFHAKNNFRNQVLKVETYLSPEEVIKEIYIIESHFGRKRNPERYSSRKMDIDILFYDDLVIKTKDLAIPHPHIAGRRFVLVPFNDLMPGFIDPASGKTISELLAGCEDLSEVIRINSGL
jgi:2-amino-4-hydroxy-6-hydroxymethyldihydropteridine diphosphokinase